MLGALPTISKLQWLTAVAILAVALPGVSPGRALALSFERTDVDVGEDPIGVAAGPIDGDGIGDLAVANRRASSVSILRGTAGAGFIRDDVKVGAAPEDVAIGRFNGDRRPDLAVACRSGVVSVLLAKQGGRYKRRDAKVRGAANGLAVGRLNGDRRDDVAVANAYRSRQRSVSVEILVGKPRGRLKRTDVTRFGEGAGDPSDVALGRFDANRRTDLAVSMSDDGFGGGGATVLLGKRRGKFRFKGYFGGGGDSTSVEAGTLDGDAEVDLVTTDPGGFNRLGMFAQGGVEALLGRGTGAFSRASSYPTGEEAAPIDSTLADLDQDGVLDLATTDVAQDLVTVRLGDGNGAFPTPIEVPVGSRPRGIAASDLSGDGRPDLAVANSLGGDVTLLVNRGP